jgi:hypothetical protein
VARERINLLLDPGSPFLGTLLHPVSWCVSITINVVDPDPYLDPYWTRIHSKSKILLNSQTRDLFCSILCINIVPGAKDLHFCLFLR